MSLKIDDYGGKQFYRLFCDNTYFPFFNNEMVGNHIQLMEQEVYEKVAHQILLNILTDNDCINRYEPIPENLKEKAKEIAESLKPVLDEFVDCIAEGDEAVRIDWFEGYEKLSNELNEFFENC